MQSRAAIRYAKAIYEIALEENCIKELYNDMDIIKSINFDSLDFKNLLSNSLINHEEKKKAILLLTKNKSDLTNKLLDLLIYNKRVPLLADVAISFVDLYNKYNNIKEATVITASPINSDLQFQILSKINVSDIKSTRITNEVDPEIIGGFIVRYDGKQYNASVKQNINNLKKELTN